MTDLRNLFKVILQSETGLIFGILTHPFIARLSSFYHIILVTNACKLLVRREGEDISVRKKYDPMKEIRRLDYEPIYKPHSKVADYMAFYRVEYEEEVIAPPIVEKFDIGLNEIWMTERLKSFEKYILHHELQEIKHRARGFGVTEAHEKALLDGEEVWGHEKGWQCLQREINLVTEDKFCDITGWSGDFYERLVKNRPYFSLEEIKNVQDVGENELNYIKEEFWCM